MEIGKDRRSSRLALVAIVLFLAFDSIALGLNYWLSWKIEQEAIGINLAGRQRMLSQRMVKVLLQIDQARIKGEDPAARLDELKLTFDLFDDTLKGFDQGHMTRGGANQKLFLPAVKDAGSRLIIREARILWAPYRQQVVAVLVSGNPPAPAVLQSAIRTAEESNLRLLDLMNKLTTELEQLTTDEAVQIRIYQTLAFILSLVNFFWAFLVYIRRIRQFSKSQSLLDDIISKVSAGVLVLNRDNRVLKANSTAETLFGYGSGDLLGRSLDSLLQDVGQNMVGLRKGGGTFIAGVERSTAVLDQQEMLIVTVLDITQQRMLEEHLSSLAYNDPLTHLPNRLQFDDRLRLEISHAQRGNTRLAVLFIDLDNFKPANDTYGHKVGDLLLEQVALRLKSCVRESDTVSRRGGTNSRPSSPISTTGKAVTEWRKPY